MSEAVSTQQHSPLSHEELGSMYEKYKQQLLAYLYGRVQSPEDTLQTMLLKMTETMHEGKFIDKNPGGYMYMAANHLAIDEYRRHKRIPMYSIEQQQQAHPTFDIVDPNTMDPSQTIEISDRMEKALSKLPPQYRKALLLYEVEGLEYKEVAASIGTAESGIKQYMSRARGLLREAYASLEDE